MYRHSPPSIYNQSRGRDETHLPQGECRYLLLHPEVRSQRCACVGFSLNRSTPGSSCDCGHQACYHVYAKDVHTPEREEVEALKQRVLQLEEAIGPEGMVTRNKLASRLTDLEELVDRCRAEMESEIKAAYRDIEGLWHNISALQRRAKSFDDRIDSLIDANQATRDDIKTLQKRVIDVDDATMLLEERLEALSSPGNAVSPSPAPSALSASSGTEELPWASAKHSGDGAPTKTWTVYISLLPMASQPFPFEKDTQKYKRCLSRGLHRIIAVPGTDSKSFTETISKEFSGLLHGRRWMPLVAKICDAENLRGLPMLRQLPSSQVDEQLYDIDFLKNCGTLDANGNILDLYIAMCADTFSWAELQKAPPFISGLESCWDYDPVVDGPKVDDDTSSCRDLSDNISTNEEKLSAGDLLRPWSPPATRLKRTASAVSRTSSFGSTAEGETKRAKIQRQCAETTVERVGRRAEAV